MGYLAIDFGGTLTRAAWFSTSIELLHREETLSKTHQKVSTVVQRIVKTARAVIPEGETPIAIGIAAPGPMDFKSGVIYHAETLPDWKDVPLVAMISEAFDDTMTFMNNDANLGALAETYFGAARRADPVVYLTLSTGIGGGVVIDGKLFTGWRSLAIEPGHMLFTLPDGRVQRLEQLASGMAIARRTVALLEEDATIKSRLRKRKNIDAKAVGKAALAGDAFALDMIQDAGRWLGLGFVNILHMYNPEVIVLGGAVTTLGDVLLEPAREVVRENVMSPRFLSPSLIRPAELGNDVCLYGAAHYARSNSIWKN